MEKNKQKNVNLLPFGRSENFIFSAGSSSAEESPNTHTHTLPSEPPPTCFCHLRLSFINTASVSALWCGTVMGVESFFRIFWQWSSSTVNAPRLVVVVVVLLLPNRAALSRCALSCRPGLNGRVRGKGLNTHFSSSVEKADLWRFCRPPNVSLNFRDFRDFRDFLWKMWNI